MIGSEHYQLLNIIPSDSTQYNIDKSQFHDMKVFIDYKGRFIFRKIKSIIFDVGNELKYFTSSREHGFKVKNNTIILDSDQRFQFTYHYNTEISMQIAGIDVNDLICEIKDNDRIVMSIYAQHDSLNLVRWDKDVFDYQSVMDIVHYLLTNYYSI